LNKAEKKSTDIKLLLKALFIHLSVSIILFLFLIVPIPACLQLAVSILNIYTDSQDGNSALRHKHIVLYRTLKTLISMAENTISF